MQTTRPHLYYSLKKIFSSWSVWINIFVLNFLFLNKYQYQIQINQLINQMQIPISFFSIRDIRSFWIWIIFSVFANIFFYLSNIWIISYLTSSLITDPSTDGEDAIFLIYSSPSKRQDLVNSKFLAGIISFILINILISLSSCYFWFENCSGIYDYLYILFQLLIIPITIFFLLITFFFWLFSIFENNPMIIKYIIPSTFSTISHVFPLGIFILRRELILESNIIFDFLSNYSMILFSSLTAFSLFSGTLFYYLYSDKFNKKDIV